MLVSRGSGWAGYGGGGGLPVPNNVQPTVANSRVTRKERERAARKRDVRLKSEGRHAHLDDIMRAELEVQERECNSGNAKSWIGTNDARRQRLEHCTSMCSDWKRRRTSRGCPSRT